MSGDVFTFLRLSQLGLMSLLGGIAMEIGRVVGNDGKLLGFNITGRMICRDDRMDDDLSMRRLEIDVLAELMKAPLDRSVQAERLIRLDDQRIADLHSA